MINKRKNLEISMLNIYSKVLKLFAKKRNLSFEDVVRVVICAYIKKYHIDLWEEFCRCDSQEGVIDEYLDSFTKRG